VALHGITDNGRTWSRVAEGLAADYDVIMLDARGHGLSEATESGYTAEDQAPDVAGVIRALGLGRVVLLGHSMGGATAVATAAAFPDLVRALILEDPPWGGPPDSATPAEHAARSADWQRSILRRKAQAISEIVTFGRRRLPDWDERDVAVWAEAKQQTSPNIVNGINGRGIRWQDVVRQVRCPVWVIYGDRAAGSGSQARSTADALGPASGRARESALPGCGTAGSRGPAGAILSPETVQEAQSLCPGVKAVHVPGAGHEIRRGHYPQFMAALRACLHDIEKSDS
jgi:pimeloyl-ACP methyl ester carboxylesterase